jgi:hypothetical protein
MSASSGLSACTICTAGSIAAAAGSSVCSTCLPETYVSTQGSTACLGCNPACSITQHTEIQCTPSTNRVCCDRLVTYIRGYIPKYVMVVARPPARLRARVQPPLRPKRVRVHAMHRHRGPPVRPVQRRVPVLQRSHGHKLQSVHRRQHGREAGLHRHHGCRVHVLSHGLLLLEWRDQQLHSVSQGTVRLHSVLHLRRHSL